MKTIDRATVRMIQQRMQTVLEDLGKELGLSFRAGNARFDDASATVKVHVGTIGKGGVVVDPLASDFKKYAKMYGLKPAWLGKSFKWAGQQYRIVGLNTRGRVRPVIVERNGRRFRASEQEVAQGMRKVA